MQAPSVKLDKFDRLIDNKFWALIFFLCLALLIRLPDFFPYEIDWDESTSILIAQDVVNGYLPLTNYWCGYPPLLYLPFALTILLFGKSIIAIRVLGLLCILSTAFIIYLLGKRIYGRLAGFWAGVIHIIYSSTFHSGQSTMGEHIASVPISLFLWFLITGKKKSHVFWAGVFLSIATLVRHNIVYFVLVAFLVVLLRHFRQDKKRALSDSLSFFLGYLFPIFAVSAVYFANHEFDTLKRTMIDACLVYIEAQSEKSFLGISMGRVERTIDLFKMSIVSHRFFIWLASLAGFLLGCLSQVFNDEQRKTTRIFLIFFISMLLSILTTGWGYGHYLIPLLPMLSITAGLLIAYGFSLGRWKWIIALMVASSFLWTLYPLRIKYEQLDRPDRVNVLNQYLEKTYNLSGRYVFFATHHILYWFTDSLIPTKQAHPSNLEKEAFISAFEGKKVTQEGMVREIFEKKPALILMPKKGIVYLNENAQNLVNREIDENYTIDIELGDNRIYIRKDFKIGTVAWWKLLSQEEKLVVIRNIKKIYKKKDNVTILEPAEFYLPRIESMINNVPDHFKIPDLLKIRALEEKDFKVQKAF